jgi:Family of unknown function (DUF5996)
MSNEWPSVNYEDWSATCDTLHPHAQLLGKLAVALAPPEPELQHAALRVTARGWETLALPAPDGSGAVLAGLDLHAHEAFIEHSNGRGERIALTPNRPVGEVTRDVLTSVRTLAGFVEINTTPQEVPWTVPLDEDDEHATYDPDAVGRYFAAATRAALVLAAFRAPYRGRSTPVNAWWGTFDLATALMSGRPTDPPGEDFITRNAADAESMEVGWWPGDRRYGRAAFFAFAFPSPEDFSSGQLAPAAARWDVELGEYILDWDDVRSGPDPHGSALSFAHSAFLHACKVCDWDPALPASTDGSPPPIK